MKLIAARCTDCSTEFSDAELNGVTSCPKCGTTGVPCDPAQDVTVKINWHELRILTFWASNWAERLTGETADGSRRTLHSIIKRLLAYRPENGAGLTLVQEVKELQKDFPTAALYGSDGELIVPGAEDSNGDAT